MLTLFKTRLRSWIAGLRSRSAPPAPECEAGVFVPVDTVLDDVGEDPAVGLPRRWREDCRSYRLRLQVHLQEQALLGEHCNRLLEQLLASELR